jgi:hypothetical protein
MVEGSRRGPAELEKILGLIKQKKIPADSLVWRDGLEQWTAANTLPEFASVSTAKAPPPPPSPSSPPPLALTSPPAMTERAVSSDLSVSNSGPPSLAVANTVSSVIAQSISQVLGDATWRALLSSGLKPDAVVACIPVLRLKLNDEPNESAAANAMSLFRKVSNKISDLTDRGELMGQNYLIDGGHDQFYVASKLAGKSDVFPLQRKSFYVSNRWKDEKLEMELQVSDNSSRVKSLVCRLHAGEPIPDGFVGSALPLLTSASMGAPDVGPGAFATLFRTRLSIGQRNSFNTVFSTPASISIVDLDDTGIRIWHSGKPESILLRDMLAWQASETSVSILAYSSNHVRRWVIALPGQIDRSESMENKGEASDSQVTPAEVVSNSSNPTKPAEGDSMPSLDVENLATTRKGNLYEAKKSLAAILSFLESNQERIRSQYEMLAAELDGNCIFTNKPTQLLMKLRDSECTVALKEGSVDKLQWIPNARLYAFGDLQFLQLSPDSAYRIHIAESERRLAEALSLALSETASLDGSVVLLSRPGTQLQYDGESIPWDELSPFLLKFENGTLRFANAHGEAQKPDELETQLDKVGARSQIWKDTFGVVSIDLEGESSGRLLLASNRTLIQLWEQAELRSLTVRTTGVPLGKLYQEYNKSRCEKYITGVFGNFFIAQQQLEQSSSLDSLVQEISAAPPGPLPGDLSDRLIQRLSILEVSRYQLSRWLDRCALMYPHYMAQCEREWLANAFGDRIVDRTTQDRESWRVHQQMRGELRQVQASMGKALAEVGQNLHAISWAFPEEVRFAALAGMRRAAGLAEKGAMLAAFGGIGGQLLLGLGRASVGDPLGFAMVGALGLSLVGKQLDKNVKEKEKLIRLRAYGVQAIQWWDTTLETASVMAMECRHAMELARQAAMLRDRQILEKLSPDELSKAQHRMAAIMRRTLHEDVSSQFYEAVPGSGLFGWHLVDHITEIASERSVGALSQFRSELPGAMADSDRYLTVTVDSAT